MYFYLRITAMRAKVNGYSCICDAVTIFLIANSCIGFELRITNSLEDQITLNEYTDFAQKFIDCMRAKDSTSCNIEVVKKYRNSWYIDNVYKIPVLATVIVVYCVSKRHRFKNTTSANTYVNDSTVNNNQFISMKSLAPSTLETVSGDIEQSFQNKHNNNASRAYFNISLNNNRDEKLDNSMSYEVIPVDDGVYLNTSSFDVIDKTYSRLGEQVRVIADDYNSLLPEDEHSHRFIDSTTIPEEMKDNASNKTKNTEYALTKDTMSITDTPTNPYSLAKVVSTCGT
ncbi:hypothetical protein Bpfe_026712 [Biomphalaria pfeifferi]|uniref:Uncharacterized protein n=1 Tax=Biomphalaria pfeifferi TaxID=112525 RepID=A0AAD8AZE1_BIOPF|nr:hypothetical protein Bpfe_026712 [Biomphalaria pfeifferi]